MSKFILSMTRNNIASQIAHLLNIGNQFYYTIMPYHILHNNIKYLIELDRDRVIGVVGLQVKSPYVTELKHLAVHPQYRRRGIGKKLLEIGIKFATTPYIYGVVRSNNSTNIRNNLRLGMIPIAYYCSRSPSYKMIIFAKSKIGAEAKYVNRERT